VNEYLDIQHLTTHIFMTTRCWVGGDWTLKGSSLSIACPATPNSNKGYTVMKNKNQMELFGVPVKVLASNKEFWDNVNVGSSSGCWEWKHATSCGGYGIYWTAEKSGAIAHVIAYNLAHGEVPAGMEVSHSCHNPRCCAPHHLRAISHQENMAEAGERRRGKPLRVLSEDVVRAARLRRTAGELIKDIAAAFSVRADTIALAINRKTWAWVDEARAA